MKKKTAKRGSYGPRDGSNTARLLTMQLGERHYSDTTADRYAADMRALSVARSRRPASIKNHEFECRLFVAVGGTCIRHVLCLERVK